MPHVIADGESCASSWQPKEWEGVHVKFPDGEMTPAQGDAILKAVAREGERQAVKLEEIRDKAWQVFSSAGCPKCRAHAAQPVSGAMRARLLIRCRLIAALGSRRCGACGHVW